MQKTKHYTYKTGKLAKGCELCVQGKKLVLLATGICPRRCYYCPLSDEKKDKDIVYANEWKNAKDSEIIKEAKLCDAKGAGITGGDPLAVFERTIRIIKLLKKKIGKKFHIHLYTSFDLVTRKKLEKLYKAGLDEIRFHPDLDNKKLWDRIALAKGIKFDVGVEIPAIPGYETRTKELIDFLNGKIDFLNLNELEISDTNANKLIERGFMPKDSSSYAIKGSDRIAKKLLGYCEKKKINAHYCTAKSKDKVQLANRIKRRAQNVKKAYDILLEDGTLFRGAIYLPELSPGFGYHKKIEGKKGKIISIKSKLYKLKNKLIKEYKIPKNLIAIDENKLRLLTAVAVVEKLKKELKKLKLKPAVVQEYPTWDSTELMIEFL